MPLQAHTLHTHTFYTHTSTHISHTFHTHFTHISRTFHTHFTHISQTFHRHFTHISHTFHTHFTHISHTFHAQRILGPERAKGAHNCYPSIPHDMLGGMGKQGCALADVCYRCGGGNVNCKWQSITHLCKPRRADIAPWLLAIQDAQLAGKDLPSKLSQEMDTKCVFVCGLGRVLQHNSIAMVEAGIIGHVSRSGPHYRIVIRGNLGHAFIFCGDENHKNSFLEDTKMPGSSWGSIVVCNWRLGVKANNGEHYRHAGTGAARPAVAAVTVPSSPVTQPINQTDADLEALHSMAQRVQAPVGGGYGVARQVIRVGVPEAMVEDMSARNFDWARVSKFIVLQPGGMSRIFSLCGTYSGRQINMITEHEEGGANSDNRTVVLNHLMSRGHRHRVATKRDDAAAAAHNQLDTTMSQSDGTYMHHRFVHTPIATSHTTSHDPLC